MPENIYNPKEDCQITGLEWIYCGVFGLKKNGTFVEVGAHDGRSWSNTAFLADLGWKGVYIEPIEHLAQQCIENHKGNNVTVVQKAIGSGNKISMKFNKDTWWLYTGDADYAKLNSALVDVGEFETVMLDDILASTTPLNFDLLVIDVEGMEVDVLKGFSCSLWQPKMVIIETHELNPNAEMAQRTEFINNYFRSLSHYMKIYTSAINTIFVRTS